MFRGSLQLIPNFSPAMFGFDLSLSWKRFCSANNDNVTRNMNCSVSLYLTWSLVMLVSVRVFIYAVWKYTIVRYPLLPRPQSLSIVLTFWIALAFYITVGELGILSLINNTFHSFVYMWVHVYAQHVMKITLFQ